MIGRCVAMLAAILFLAAPAVAQRRGGEFVVTGDGIVPATLNGVAGRIRIDPAVPALPMLSTRWAGQAQLRPGPFAFGIMVGPQQIDGVTAVARIGVGAGAEQRRRRVGWTRLPYIRNADGVVGPGGLPHQVIRFVLRPSLPGERTVALPMVNEGGLFGGWGGMWDPLESTCRHASLSIL